MLEALMDATMMLREFCDAVERRDGKRFADLFCEDGVYHDVFYGEFAGRAKIAEMIDDWFYKSATDMRWDMHDPVLRRKNPLCSLHLQLHLTAAGSGWQARDV
jgi:ketosteroid isomerase-like protein